MIDIAYPYAKAIFGLAVKHNNIREWDAFLKTLEQIVADKKIQRLCHAPKKQQDKILALLCELTSHELQAITPLGDSFLRLLVGKKYLAAIPKIAKLYREFYVEYAKIKNIIITTAFALDDVQRQILDENLRKKIGQNIQLSYIVNIEIIAGMILQIGDKVIDGSVRNKLKRAKWGQVWT